MKTTAFVSHPDCSRHDTGWGHPEHQGRLPAVARAVYRDMLTLFEPLLELEAVPATEADLLLGHSPEYVAHVRALCQRAEATGQVVSPDGETPVSGASWDAALAAVGAGITAVEAVLAGEARNAFCAVRPPGHRAGIRSGGGHGLFNPVAIAAQHLRQRRGLGRVLIVGFGASDGTGTREIVESDAAIRFVSVHGGAEMAPADRNRWTARARAGADGAEMSRLLDAQLDAALADFEPEFLLLSLGCDALATDPFGQLRLVPADFFLLTNLILSRSAMHGSARLVSVLEEGYDPAGMGQAVVQHLRALAGLDPA